MENATAASGKKTAVALNGMEMKRMSELKPCPMSTDEAIGVLRGLKMMVGTVANEALDIAISALHRAQPANEPLTLEDLRGMDGEPVWVTHKDGSGGRWGIVNSYKGTGMCADLDSYTAYWFDDWCGTIAYRRKPEGSENHV